MHLFTVNIRKIEGTEKDYEQILELDESFKLLPKEKIDKISSIAFECTKQIQSILTEKAEA